MNHRERFFTALDLEEPDYIPVTDMALDPPIVEGVLNRKQGFGLTKFGTDIISSRKNNWEQSIQFRSALIEACRKLDFDAIMVIDYYSLFTKSFQPKSLSDNKFIDQLGRVLQVSIEGKTTYFVDGTVKSPEDLEHYEPPDPFHPDIVEMMNTIIAPIKDTDIAIMAHLHTGWHLAFQIRGGIDKLAIDFYKNPAFARSLMDTAANLCQRFAESMIEAGVDVLVVGDDYADNHGPLINPKLFREYELPNLQKIVEIGKKHGIPVIKHSDGNLYPILDDIINTGVAGLHPIEPGAMDLAEVKERYGKKVCLLGNVDCRYVLPFGSEADVRKDVRRCIDAAGKDGGFILASSNSLHANVKVDNIFTMVNEARQYGKYPLK